MNERPYVIWSWRRHMYWGENHQGYTPHLPSAGLYTEGEAAEIVFSALPGQNTPVDVELANKSLQGLDRDETEDQINSWRNI